MSGSNIPSSVLKDTKDVLKIQKITHDENTLYNPDSPYEPRRRACDIIRDEVKRCIKDSDCVRIENRRSRDCVTSHDIPSSCQRWLNGLYNCKRTMVFNIFLMEFDISNIPALIG